MAKKLRDSAYVNDLVLYRNACEEKKLKFTLSQLENLKSVYSRQKEQEKMFFAVQHMAVPVKTDPVIMNLRRSLEKNRTNRTKPTSILHHDDDLSYRNASRVTFSEDKVLNSAKQNSVKIRYDNIGRASNVSRGERSPDLTTPGHKNVNQKLKRSPVGPRNKINSSIRVISPSPKRLNTKRDALPRHDLVSKQTPHFDLQHENFSADDDFLLHDEDYDFPDDQEKARSIIKSLDSRRYSSWGKDEYLAAKRQAFAPRISDLPPLDINIYENPCGEKESREKWQQLVYCLKNSSIEETRTDVELTKYNQEIRKKWQSTYSQIKRDRITAMIKDKMKINDGEQLTLVKFLPKSRQTDFIKEAQLTQHKM